MVRMYDRAYIYVAYVYAAAVHWHRAQRAERIGNMNSAQHTVQPSHRHHKYLGMDGQVP